MLRGLQTLNNDPCSNHCNPLPPNYKNDPEGCCAQYGCNLDEDNGSCESKNITPPSPVPDGNKSGNDAYNKCHHYIPQDEDGFASCCAKNCCGSPNLTVACQENNCFTTCHQSGILPPQPNQPQPNQPQPNQPQPQPNQPQPSKNKCGDYQYMSSESGKCVTITKDSKWTKDFYNFFLNNMIKNIPKNIPKNYVICAVSNMTTQFTPYEVFNADNDKDKDVQNQLEELMGKCRDGKIKDITPKLYSDNSGPGPGPSKNTNHVLIVALIVGLVVLFVGLAVFFLHYKNII